MKYRRLSSQQLQTFEKEFIDFLVINGITGQDWKRLKVSDLDAANTIIDQFSDVIFEGVFQKVQFIQRIDRYSLKCFQCLPKKMILMGMDIPQNQGYDLQDQNFIEQATSHPPEGIDVYCAEKPYRKQREIEIFHLLEAGATIDEGKYFKALSLVYARNQ